MKIIHKVEAEQTEIDELYDIAYEAGALVNDSTLTEEQKVSKLEMCEKEFSDMINRLVNVSFMIGKKASGADAMDAEMYKL